VIASDIGGIPTVIKDGRNGILVKPKDVKALASSITRILQDGELAQRLSAEARKTIEEGFSRERMVTETVKVYKGVIG
jgi:glycosyltransferase involved in cell wall biosynthesis